MFDIATATTSPYLNALRAAAVDPQLSNDDDFCFVCGNLTLAGDAYCSSDCRAQDEAPSPDLTALPALVPSRTGLHKQDGSASSAPSSATSTPDKIGHGKDGEDDIDELELPPSVASYNKKPTFGYGYTYNLATSPAMGKTPTKSPMVRPAGGHNSVLSPKQGPTRPSTGNASASNTPPLNPTEVITFRRRFQPDNINGSKQGNVTMSPALLARRRSSNQPSPLLLGKHDLHGSALAFPSIPSKNVGGANSRTTAAHANISKQLNSINGQHSRKSSKSEIILPSASYSSFGLGHKTASTATLRAHAQPTCARKGCPVPHPGETPSFQAMTRRVSEPLSPYASPGIQSNPHDPFDIAFDVSTTSSTAPPMVPMSQSTKPFDYSGIAGYLFNRHNQSRPKDAEAVRTGTAASSESGYDAQDEQERRRAKPSSPVLQKKTTSKDALYMKSKSDAARPAKASILKEKLANLLPGSSSSSSSDSSDVGAKPSRFLFGRGNAFKSTLREDSTDTTGDSSSSEEEEVGIRDNEQDDGVRGRRSRQTSTQTARPRHNHSTSVGEGSQYIVTGRPSQRSQAAPVLRHTSVDSALASSSSSSDDEEASKSERMVDPAADERGRSRGRKSSTANRVPLVSPFTALQRVTSGQQARRKSDSQEEGGRGRSSRREGSAAVNRSTSPARSSSRAGARTRRRVPS